MDVTKLLPMATVGGVGATNTETIEEVIKTPVDLAKTAATQMELSNMYKMVLTKGVSDDLDPRFIQNFSDFLRNNFNSPTGRDIAFDYWSEPYLAADFGSEYQFWSTGPDGIDDTDDDVWVTLPKSMIP